MDEPWTRASRRCAGGGRDAAASYSRGESPAADRRGSAAADLGGMRRILQLLEWLAGRNLQSDGDGHLRLADELDPDYSHDHAISCTEESDTEN